MYADGRVRYQYIRDSKEQPQGCVAWRATSVADGRLRVEFGASFTNPKDQFNREKARTLAGERLNVCFAVLTVDANMLPASVGNEVVLAAVGAGAHPVVRGTTRATQWLGASARIRRIVERYNAERAAAAENAI